jgi:hypothetical protein
MSRASWIEFNRFFSVDSPKAIKANEYGWLNAINYMSPARSGGVGNLCPHASAGCIALCLGLESGQAAMVSRATGTNSVRESRARKARYFMERRESYMREMLWHIASNLRAAKRKGLRLAVRPNGASDIAYEGVRVFISPEYAATLARVSGEQVASGLQSIFTAFPTTQFVDYTKNPHRMRRALPSNYSLTFSRSETNEADCIAVLQSGGNVAVVFAKGLPATWNGFPVIDGDKHDLRHLDPRGVVVGLSPKGAKARRDTSGFVVREAV